MSACKILKTGSGSTYLTIQKGHRVVRDDHSQWCMAGMREKHYTRQKMALFYMVSDVFLAIVQISPFILLACFRTFMFLPHTHMN